MIFNILISSMNEYRKKYSNTMHALFNTRELKNGGEIYLFKSAVNSYFKWVEDKYRYILENVEGETLYIHDANGQNAKALSLILGLLEAFNVLNFKINGGADSQLYIYVYQISRIKMILSHPQKYQNRLLKLVKQRHLLSSQMLTYIYENNFTSNEIWDILEDYFLGKIPNPVMNICKEKDKTIAFQEISNAV